MSTDVAQGSRSDERASGWGDLQISFKPIGFVPYRDYCIYVYESLDAEKPEADKSRLQYFYTPVLLLEPKTAEYQYLIMGRKHAVSFKVVMWNEEVTNIVVDYMHKDRKMSVERAQMKPIPFEQLMLTFSSSTVCDDVCDIHPNKFLPYQMHKDVKFNLICSTEEKAKEIAETMRTQPSQFEYMFEMKLILSKKQTERRETMISVENALEGELFSELLQKFPANNRNEVLLTAEDTKRLLDEATKKVAIRAYSEDLMNISSGNEREIYALLEKMMVHGEEMLDGQSEEWRRSVFWNEDNYRPDKIANELNEVHTHTATGNPRLVSSCTGMPAR